MKRERAREGDSGVSVAATIRAVRIAGEPVPWHNRPSPTPYPLPPAPVYRSFPLRVLLRVSLCAPSLPPSLSPALSLSVSVCPSPPPSTWLRRVPENGTESDALHAP